MNRLAIAAATLALLAAACAAGTGGPTDTDVTGPAAPTGTTPPASTAPLDDGTMAEMDQAMINAVVEQAAEETGVGADEISVVTAEAVTWPDGALGCPEPGMAYTQALVPGFRIVLDVAGEEIHYHAASDGRFFACDDPQEPIDDGTTDR